LTNQGKRNKDFFNLIGPSNASKHPQRLFDRSQNQTRIDNQARWFCLTNNEQIMQW